MRRKRNKLRILHCPTYGVGNPGMLAAAERSLGLSSYSVSIEPAMYGFHIDFALNPFRRSWLSLLFREILRWPLLIYALIWSDIVHYNFGQTIMPQWYGGGSDDKVGMLKRFTGSCLKLYVTTLERFDLKLLKICGKKIIITYQGDDARQGDYCRKYFKITAANYVNCSYYTKESDDNKRRLINEMACYADEIYAFNPDLLNILPEHSKFIPYVSVDLGAIDPVNSVSNKKPLVIHAPTHRGVKGTKFIVNAIEMLQSEGVEFDFELIEGLSHKDALKTYERADLLIDQLLIGWYGGLAVELMAMGKPVICYIREEDLVFLPDGMRQDLPIINANPENIYEVLKQKIQGESIESLVDIGKRSRIYVEKWHDPQMISLQLKANYESILSK